MFQHVTTMPQKDNGSVLMLKKVWTVKETVYQVLFPGAWFHMVNGGNISV
ncbi:MAG: hypothetical protein CM15mP23_08880 [Cryomorphaceae bacterium]|nr:MAG: hypothetical protein CM15mP23_08880 [Cryomorphaceae bacterium]